MGLSHGLLRIEVKEQEGLSHGLQHGDPQGCSQPLRETRGGIFVGALTCCAPPLSLSCPTSLPGSPKSSCPPSLSPVDTCSPVKSPPPCTGMWQLLSLETWILFQEPHPSQAHHPGLPSPFLPGRMERARLLGMG